MPPKSSLPSRNTFLLICVVHMYVLRTYVHMYVSCHVVCMYKSSIILYNMYILYIHCSYICTCVHDIHTYIHNIPGTYIYILHTYYMCTYMYDYSNRTHTYIHMNLHKILSLLNHCSKVNGSGSCPSAIGVIKRDGEGDCCGVD